MKKVLCLVAMWSSVCISQPQKEVPTSRIPNQVFQEGSNSDFISRGSESFQTSRRSSLKYRSMLTAVIGLSLLLQPSATVAEDLSGSIRGKRNKRKQSVGIVGAGLSGLFSAWRLARMGYRDITIYEKSDHVGGVISTFTLDDGRPFDLATMWVPDSSVYGAGILKEYKKVLKSFDQSLVYGDLQGTLVTPDGDSPQQNLPLTDLHPGAFALMNPPFSLSRTQMISLNVEGFKLLKNFRSCIDQGLSCTECGICESASELPEEFGVRTGTQALMLSFGALVNTLGAGPTNSNFPLRTAEFILKTSTTWYPPVMIQAFNFLGATTDELMQYNAEPELIEIMESNRFSGPVGYLNLQEGFQAFAESIAQEFSVKLNTTVEAVKADDDSWVVETNQGSFCHDILILANPPRLEADKEMFPEGSVKSAIDLIDTTQPESHILLYDIGDSEWNSNLIPEKSAFIRFFAANGPSLPFTFFVKRYADNGAVEIAGGVPQGILSAEDLAGLAEIQLGGILSTNANITKLSQSKIMFPPLPLPQDEQEWQDNLKDIEELRDDGLYIVGEHVCGTGIPEIALCIDKTFKNLKCRRKGKKGRGKG
ncbi:MAG: FAD-dependent oxidoreductase [Oligoflexales bacterium]